jgi:hypothetical protein
MGNGVFGEMERGAAGLLRAALGCLLAGSVALAACSSDSTGACPGVTIGGKCEKKCVESECAEPGMKCVNNACEQPCTGHADCPTGKACFGTTTDDGTPGQFCDSQAGLHGLNEACTGDQECDALHSQQCKNGLCTIVGCLHDSDCQDLPGKCVDDTTPNATQKICVAGTPVFGFDHDCTDSSQCDAGLGMVCSEGKCTFTCQSHQDCASVGLCQPSADGTLVCKKGTTYPAGQFGTSCPGGPNGNECDADNGFTCLGYEGDVDSYCTKSGCQADSDCGTGYSCETVRTSRVPCQTACGIPGNTTVTNCVPSDKLGNGKEFSCGPVSLLRSICIKRDYCTSCDTDDDCRAMPNQICAKDGSGNKICTVVCDPNVSDNACPWGSASKCELTDTDLGQPTCSHKFGSCVGTGKGCEPCIDDLDCPNGLCLSSSFSGEKYCADLGVSCDCTGLPVDQGVLCTGGGCPDSPGGVTLQCYGGSQVVGSALYQKCVGADVNTNPAGSPKTGCWYPN